MTERLRLITNRIENCLWIVQHHTDLVDVGELDRIHEMHLVQWRLSVDTKSGEVDIGVHGHLLNPLQDGRLFRLREHVHDLREKGAE